MSYTNFQAIILADSTYFAKAGKKPNNLTTLMLTYPRCIHSEFMTHRSHSRNAASSRAIPIKKMIRDVVRNPYVPLHWGANQKGMQAREELSKTKTAVCRTMWLLLRWVAVLTVWSLSKIGLHKQIANRLLEPWMWITVITTANKRGWDNFFRLRCHPDAEPHIQKIAEMTREAMGKSITRILTDGEWHLPLIGRRGGGNYRDTCRDYSDETLVKACVGRCARVSYLTHEGVRDIDKDVVLHDQLSKSGHWSPFEHACQLNFNELRVGGNVGYPWKQYRKTFEGEFGKDD